MASSRARESVHGGHKVFIMFNRVAVLGGGVGGLSAAHELIERWALVFQEIFGGIGVPDNEVLLFTDRILTLLTSSPAAHSATTMRTS